MTWKITHGSTRGIIHNILVFHKLHARCITKQLTEYHKHILWISASTFPISVKTNCLICIVSEDEVQILYCDPESECKSMELICLQTPVKGKFRMQPTASKGMPTDFFFIHECRQQSIMKRSATVNSACYCEMCDKKRLAV